MRLQAKRAAIEEKEAKRRSRSLKASIDFRSMNTVVKGRTKKKKKSDNPDDESQSPEPSQNLMSPS